MIVLSDKDKTRYYDKLSSMTGATLEELSIPTPIFPDSDTHNTNHHPEQMPSTTTINPNDFDLYMSSVTNLKMGRVDLSPEMFDRLIWQKGYTAIWEQATYCCCVDMKTGQPDYNCKVCDGCGFMYIKPRRTKILASSLAGRKDYEKTGFEDKGSVYLTPLSIDIVGIRDRITFPEFVIRQSELLRKTSDNVDYTRYPIKDIVSISWFNKVYEYEKDFTIEEPNKIVWKDTAERPNDGSRISILYLTTPSYVLITPMHELRGTYVVKNGKGKDYFVRLPSQYQARREDFLNSSGIFGGVNT